MDSSLLGCQKESTTTLHILACSGTTCTCSCLMNDCRIFLSFVVVCTDRLTDCFTDWQLYGEYQEHQGGSGRREATRLLTERQIKKHGNHPRSHARTRHGHGRRGHGQNGYHSRHGHQHGFHSRQRNRRHTNMEAEADADEQTAEPDIVSSIKKRRSYSKCRGERFWGKMKQ